MSGTYANAVMIGHTATEFSFDFITTFFPKSTVSSRVFLSAPNVPRLLDSLKHSWGQYQRKIEERRAGPRLATGRAPVVQRLLRYSGVFRWSSAKTVKRLRQAQGRFVGRVTPVRRGSPTPPET